MQSDPFGFPVSAYVAERAPSRNDRGGAPVCIRRALDSDADRLPDQVEGWLGSDPLSVDTDMDGVTDGEAALMGVHPVNGGPLPEGVLLGPPDGPAFLPARDSDAGVGMDAGMDDAGTPLVDLGTSDAFADVGMSPDQTLPDDGTPPGQAEVADAAAVLDGYTRVDGSADVGSLPASPASNADGGPISPHEEGVRSRGDGCTQPSGGGTSAVVMVLVVVWCGVRRRNSSSKTPD